MKTILIVAAHPDDEILGCGGTVARLIRDGYEAYTLILGEGITSRDERRNRNARRKEIEQLKIQIKEASKILGVKKEYVFDFPDNRFDTVPLLDIIKTIENVKKEVNPEIVFTHHFGDLNIDHRITFNAVMTAFRPVTDESVSEIYSFEIPSSTEWNFQNYSEVFSPNFFSPLGEEHLKAKVDAMKCYKDEVRNYPHPRSLEAIETLAKYRGINCGYKYAEAFQTIRLIKRM